MNILLRSLSFAVLLGSLYPTSASAAEIKGILMDKHCAPTAELRIVPPPKMMEGGRVVAEAHTRECLLMPECIKSGYTVYTTDDKFLSLDDLDLSPRRRTPARLIHAFQFLGDDALQLVLPRRFQHGGALAGTGTPFEPLL